MLAAVFSDSHGNVENMVKVIQSVAPDCIIHLGDCVRDAEKVRKEFPRIPMYSVRGNCDLPDCTPEYEMPALDGVRLFIAHGHRHNVKINMDAFMNAVYFSGAELGLYGHTHRPYCREADGLTIMNPGSCGDPLHPTYGLVEIRAGEIVRCGIHDIL